MTTTEEMTDPAHHDLFEALAKAFVRCGIWMQHDADTITALRARVGELEGQVAAVRSVEAGLDGLLSLTDFTSDDFRDACDALSGAPSDLSARLSNRYNIILSALEVAGNAFQLASFHARSILSSTEDEK